MYDVIQLSLEYWKCIFIDVTFMPGSVALHPIGDLHYEIGRSHFGNVCSYQFENCHHPFYFSKRQRYEHTKIILKGGLLLQGKIINDRCFKTKSLGKYLGQSMKKCPVLDITQKELRKL
jgi:hypothetical protein